MTSDERWRILTEAVLLLLSEHRGRLRADVDLAWQRGKSVLAADLEDDLGYVDELIERLEGLGE